MHKTTWPVSGQLTRSLLVVLFSFLLMPVDVSGQTAGLVNIAPLFTATSRPGGTFLSRSIDGINGSAYAPAWNDYVPNKSFFFRSSTAVPVRQVRFSLPPNFYSLWADTTGSGSYDTRLLNVKNGPTSLLWGTPEWTWGTWTGGPLNIYGLRLDEPSIYRFTKSGFAGTPPRPGDKVYQWSASGALQHRSGVIVLIDDQNIWLAESDGEGWTWETSGWLSSSSVNAANRWEYAAAPENANPDRNLYEFEIYADNGELSATARANLEAAKNPPLDAGVPVVSTGESLSPGAAAPADQFLKGMYIEVWMFGLGEWIGSSPRAELRNWPPYQNMVSRVKKLGANFVWLMPVRSGWSNGAYTADWYNSEVLWPSNYIASSSPENYLAYLAEALHADGIKLFAGDRPNGWPPKSGVAESEVWPGAVTEMVKSGVDGVAVLFDEQGNQASAEQLSQYAAAADAAHAANPNVLTFANHQVPSGTNRTFPVFAHTVNTDLLGTEGYFTMDDPWGHWMPAFHTAEMVGANPGRRAVITQNTPWAPSANNPLFYETFTPPCLYGSALSVVFHGGEAVSYWRLNFQNDLYTDSHVPKGYSMLDTLSAWGGRRAVVPGKILVLESNRQASRFSSYDYSYHFLDQFPYANKTGFYNTEMVFEALLKAGLPYQVRYTDYPADFPDTAGLKAIVVPFAYAGDDPLPQATVNYLQTAANRGVKIIILNRPGIHPYYVMFSGYDTLIESPDVTVLSDDFSYGLTPTLHNRILDPILAALGNERPTYLKAYGHDVEVALLEGTGVNAGSKYLLTTNWENRPATIDVGLALSAGAYRVMQRDLSSVKPLIIGGRTSLGAAELAKFRITLEAGEARIFYITPSAAAVPSRPADFRLVAR